MEKVDIKQLNNWTIQFLLSPDGRCMPLTINEQSKAEIELFSYIEYLSEIKERGLERISQINPLISHLTRDMPLVYIYNIWPPCSLIGRTASSTTASSNPSAKTAILTSAYLLTSAVPTTSLHFIANKGTCR